MNSINAPMSSMRMGLYGTALATLMIFAGWCVIDFFAVRQADYPARVHEHEWIILLLPIPAFLACYLFGRVLKVASSFWIAVPLSIPLIAIFGVWFHFSIGGRL
jgi:hypothetical protein